MVFKASLKPDLESHAKIAREAAGRRDGIAQNEQKYFTI